MRAWQTLSLRLRRTENGNAEAAWRERAYRRLIAVFSVVWGVQKERGREGRVW